MPEVKKQVVPKTMKPTSDDLRIIAKLEKKTGLKYSQIVRLGLRALAAKEGISI